MPAALKISPAVGSWALSILTAIGAMFVAFGLAEGLPLPADEAETIGFLAHDLVVAAGCFLICRWNPRHLLLTFFFSNGVGILAACIEPTFWHDTKWIAFSIGWVLSLVTAVVGANRGRELAVKRAASGQNVVRAEKIQL